MTILKNCLRRIFGKKINVAFMVVIPIILNILIITINVRDIKYNVGIIDLDQSKYTNMLIDYLEKDCNVTILDAKEDTNSLILNSKQDIVFSIPDNFSKDLVAQINDVKVQSYYMDGSNAVEPIEINVASFISASKEIAKVSNKNEQTFYDGMKSYLDSHYKVTYSNFASGITEEVGMAVDTLGYLAFDIAFLMAFATALVLEDKILGVYRRMHITPLKEVSYYAQNLLSYFFVALIQISIVVLILPEVVDVSYGDNVLGVIGICSCFAGVCISIGLTISKLSKTNLVANALVTIIELPMLMLGGCLWPFEIMPEFLQKIGEFMPSRWFLLAAESFLYQEDFGNYAKYVCYMLGLIAVLMVGAFMFSKSYDQ